MFDWYSTRLCALLRPRLLPRSTNAHCFRRGVFSSVRHAPIGAWLWASTPTTKAEGGLTRGNFYGRRVADHRGRADLCQAGLLSPRCCSPRDAPGPTSLRIWIEAPLLAIWRAASPAASGLSSICDDHRRQLLVRASVTLQSFLTGAARSVGLALAFGQAALLHVAYFFAAVSTRPDLPERRGEADRPKSAHHLFGDYPKERCWSGV